MRIRNLWLLDFAPYLVRVIVERRVLFREAQANAERTGLSFA
jgi:hypothetical protein